MRIHHSKVAINSGILQMRKTPWNVFVSGHITGIVKAKPSAILKGIPAFTIPITTVALPWWIKVATNFGRLG